MKVEIMTTGKYYSFSGGFSGATTFTGKIKLKSGESVACKARREPQGDTFISTDDWRTQWRVGNETPFDSRDENRVAWECPAI